MKVREISLATAFLLGLGTLFLQTRAQSKGSSPPPTQPAAHPGPAVASSNQAEAALSVGKKIFVERCAKCHGEDGSEPVGDGLPLSKRDLTDEQLNRNVRGRLKSASLEQQTAVFLYIRSLHKN